MLSDFEHKVADFVRANGLFRSAEKILLAVSGGADSTALMHVVHVLKGEGVLGATLSGAHINHRLRGKQADEDEEFVILQAGKQGLDVTVRRIEVREFARRNGLSVETAGRKLRMEALLEIAQEFGCKCVATGHQKNDNAETVLQRLVRGTGFRGLGGIWPVRYFGDGILFVRPLLCVTRDEIIEYLRARNLKWRVDHTNYDCTYRRNFIRHRLLPELEGDAASSIVERLSELARSAQGFYRRVCSCAEKVWPALTSPDVDRMVLGAGILLGQPKMVQVELVRRSLAALGAGERNLTQKHYERILQLACKNKGGGIIELPGGFAVRRESADLVFGRAASAPQGNQKAGAVQVRVPGQTRFGDYRIEALVDEGGGREFDNFKREKSEFVEWFDLGKVKGPLSVRYRRPGDKFWPLGLAGEKKVGKFLTAQRVRQSQRRQVLIVADTQKIIWVWPVRISEQTKVTGGTRRILTLQITQAVTAEPAQDT